MSHPALITGGGMTPEQRQEHEASLQAWKEQLSRETANLLRRRSDRTKSSTSALVLARSRRADQKSQEMPAEAMPTQAVPAIENTEPAQNRNVHTMGFAKPEYLREAIRAQVRRRRRQIEERNRLLWRSERQMQVQNGERKRLILSQVDGDISKLQNRVAAQLDYLQLVLLPRASREDAAYHRQAKEAADTLTSCMRLLMPGQMLAEQLPQAKIYLSKAVKQLATWSPCLSRCYPCVYRDDAGRYHPDHCVVMTLRIKRTLLMLENLLWLLEAPPEPEPVPGTSPWAGNPRRESNLRPEEVDRPDSFDDEEEDVEPDGAIT